MAKKQDTTPKSQELMKAEKNYGDACQNYEQLARSRPGAEDMAAHTKKQREALVKKRHSRIVLDAVRTGRKVPAAADSPETAALAQPDGQGGGGQ